MAYGDRVDPKSRAASLVMMAALVSLVIWGLAVGLDVNVIKKISEKLDVVDVKEEPPPPPEEPPPPPPEQQQPPPPQVVIPPSPIARPTPNVIRDTTPTPPRIFVPTPVVTPPAPPAPPAPTVDKSRAAAPSNNAGSWATNADYPSRAEREEREGTTGFRVTIGTDGRVSGCTVTSSSGHSDLDAETCKLVTRRARFKPALDRDGNPTTSSYSNRITWRIDG
ncbi:TonB family protein [Sphingorhabdus soli]|uniref:TonB family protein n=1 Tax=Flavisphingopyxis soli TaxID=2601267 RepID=A0A5C6U5L2_9SPHN|nr:energy transducer TonB [Sphingorhabdus soli]TXC68124.1 TonB family protein [Sphingorhabdus soli]